MLSIVDVHKSFRGTTVLRGASLEVKAGETCLLVGPNGAGKSTLCEIIARVLEPARGSVVVRGSLGYAPSTPLLPEHLFVHEWMDVAAALRGASPREVDAAAARRSVPTDAKLAALSLGQRRRMILACAELGRPDLLVLDEPTVGLDDEGRALLVARLRAHPGAALVATHEPAGFAALAARTVTLRPPHPQTNAVTAG